jgi:hypothetical protein
MHRATARSRLIGFDLPSHTILLMLLMRVIIAMEVKPAYFGLSTRRSSAKAV